MTGDGESRSDLNGVEEVKAKADDVADRLIEKSDDAVAAAGDAAEAVEQQPAYRLLVTVGLIAYGVVHLLLAVLVVEVVRGAGVDATESGSVAMLAGLPFGFALVVLVVVGMAALAVWQVLEALFGYGYLSGTDLLRRKLSSLGRAVLYGGLAVAAGRVLAGVRRDHDQEVRTSEALLTQWYGPPLLVVVGLVVIGVALALVKRGVTRSFAKHDLQGDIPRWAVWLGVVGWTMKGITQLVVGALLWVAARDHDPEKVGSLDLALKAIAAQPYGRVLLIVVVAGFAAFGIYCFVWAFNARHDVSKD